MISISGVFAVTFSVVFAYVADVTTVENRSRAYGMVSATFAASLVRNFTETFLRNQKLISLFITGYFTSSWCLFERQIF